MLTELGSLPNSTFFKHQSVIWSVGGSHICNCQDQGMIREHPEFKGQHIVSAYPATMNEDGWAAQRRLPEQWFLASTIVEVLQ